MAGRPLAFKLGTRPEPFMIAGGFSCQDTTGWVPGTSTNYRTVADSTANTRHFDQSAAGAQANLEANSANGHPGLRFTRANNDAYTALRSTNATHGVGSIWCRLFVKFVDFSELDQAFRIPNSSTGARFGLQRLSTANGGHLRLNTTRFAGEGNVNFTSTDIVVPTNYQCCLAAHCNFREGYSDLWCDDQYQRVTLGVVWPSGTGRTEKVPSSAGVLLGRNGSSHFGADVYEMQWGTGVLTAENLLAWRAPLATYYAAPLQSFAFGALAEGDHPHVPWEFS